MGYVNAISILMMLASISFAKSKLPQLALKQRIQSVRFISKNGKFTYYVNSQGKLLLSTNFNIRTVLQGPKGVDFQIHGSSAQKQLIIEQIDSKHTYFGLRKSSNIFAINFGKANPTSLGKGIAPTLHLNDQWVSFYSPRTGHIIFHNIENIAIRFQIKLFNKQNPYFIPQVIMLDEQQVLFTDLNEHGLYGIIKFVRNTEKISPLLKADDYNQKIEICMGMTNLYVGFFPLKEDGKTVIFEIPTKKLNFESPKILYQSKHADVGNMIYSDQDLYFIKQVVNKKKRTEVAVITKGEVKVLSDLLNTTQIINMDGNILVPYRSKFYIIKGNKTLGEDKLNNEK